MITLDRNNNVFEVSGLVFPLFNVDRIVFNTNDKNWTQKLISARLVFEFSTIDGYKIKNPISIATFITAFHKRPVFDVPFQVGSTKSEYFRDLGTPQWHLIIRVEGIEFEESESLSIFVLEKANPDQILDKTLNYLFKKVNYYSSVERTTLKINNQLVLEKLCFSDEFIKDDVAFTSILKDKNDTITLDTLKSNLTTLFPYKTNGNQYEIQTTTFLNYINNLGQNLSLIKDEEFGTKNDGLLYSINRVLNRNASILSFRINNEKTLIKDFQNELLGKIDQAFQIDLKNIDISSPLLCLIFKKTQITLSTSQIFHGLNKNEGLRIFIDVDRFIQNIEQLGKTTRIEVELFEKDKKSFFKKVFQLNEIIVGNKFVPPFFEINSEKPELIHSSRIRIYINDQLHDQLEGTYIRNVKLNVTLKEK